MPFQLSCHSADLFYIDLGPLACSEIINVGLPVRDQRVNDDNDQHQRNGNMRDVDINIFPKGHPDHENY